MPNHFFRNNRLLISVGFALFVLIYLIIRAFNTEFISDETAAYWYYIYRGWFWGDQVVWDAANHPLNSFLGHHLYNQFGDIPGILRLGSLFSYVLYAIATYKFTGLFNRKSLQILAFIALNSIPFMLEYFAYIRGYGLSMGFFMLSIWYLYKYANAQKIVYAAASYLLIFIAVAANLTLFNSVILTVSGMAIIHLSNWKKIPVWQHAIIAGGTLVLARLCWPLLAFALKLKESGALYYSSLDGIWDMTGKSLSKYILFTDNDLLMYPFILLILLFIISLIFALKKEGWSNFLKSSETWIAFLFFGNFTAVLLMAVLMKVNYPEDRTGMYFVPLFVLLLAHLMQKVNYSEWLLLGFPLSLFLHLSIHSSVFIPEERLTRDFYNRVNAQLKPDDAVSLYHTMFANWQYLESHQDGTIHFPHTSMRQGNEADVFITRSGIQEDDSLRNPFLSTDYKLIASDPMNDHVAYRRIRPRKEQLLFSEDTTNIRGEGEFIELLNQPDFFHFNENNVDVRLVFDFHIHIHEVRQSTDFVVITQDENGQVIRYLPMALELNFQSKSLNKQLHFAVMLDNLQLAEKGIKAYLWNRKNGILHEVTNCRIEAFRLTDQ